MRITMVGFEKSAMNKLIRVKIKHLNNVYRTTKLLLEQGVLYTEPKVSIS